MFHPGVYLEQSDGTPQRIIEVPTHITAFVGYTQKAKNGEESLLHKPVRITHLSSFDRFFGGAPRDVEGNSATNHILFRCVEHFFYNGGNECIVVSVGDYGEQIQKEQLSKGLYELPAEEEFSLLVIPEAVCLPKEQCYALQREMLEYCGATERKRFAILDIYNGYMECKGVEDPVEEFRRGIGDNYLSFGAAYYPWIMNSKTKSVQPVSATVAGIYTKVDTTVGVWKAPMNVVLKEVYDMPVKLTSQSIDSLYSNNGKITVNGVIFSKGEGIMLWGSRTLDGNSDDIYSKYLNIKRTLIMLERSLQISLSPYAHLPNTPETWQSIKNLVNQYLTHFLHDGNVFGVSGPDAFSVEVGLGQTMCENDLQQGNLHIHVNIAFSRPGNSAPVLCMCLHK